jgi:hypothetical protein
VEYTALLGRRPGPPGRLIALSVSHSESAFYDCGAFVRVRRAFKGLKRRFPARAVGALARELELPPTPVPPDGLCIGARGTLRPDLVWEVESDDTARTRAARDGNLQATVWGRSALNTDPWTGLRFGAGLLNQTSHCYHAFGLIGTALSKKIGVFQSRYLKVVPISPNASHSLNLWLALLRCLEKSLHRTLCLSSGPPGLRVYGWGAQV